MNNADIISPTTFVVKTYRATEPEGRPFKLWAFRDALPSEVPTPPFDIRLECIQASNGDEWASRILGQSDWRIEYDPPLGQFNVNLQCMESCEEEEAGQSIIVGGSLLVPIEVVSYIAVRGPGAHGVNIFVSPASNDGDHDPGIYQGWDGSDWVDGSAVEINGFYWYRRAIRWSNIADYACFFAKNRRATAEEDLSFELWAFREI